MINLIKLISSLLILIVGISGCVSAQDQAIQAYCRTDARQKFPPILSVQRVQRMVLVGEKTTGFRTKCETIQTEQSRRNQGSNTTSINSTETRCINEPIKEGIYDYRWFDDQYDKNQNSRDDSYRICFAQSKSSGLFKELEK